MTLRRILISLLIAVAVVLGVSSVAQALPAYFVSNQSTLSIQVNSSAGGTFWQAPGTKSWYPASSTWKIPSGYACTWHFPYGSSRTTYGPITFILKANSVVIDRCWQV